MKEVMITLLLLLFDIGYNNGDTLSKIELNKQTDVYEMKEDKSSLAITYPKDGRNILREIIYYHIIEKPYEGDHNKVTEAPAADNLRRTLTNGHGFQYLNHIDDPKTDVDSVQTRRNEEQELNTSTSGDDYEEDVKEDEEIEATPDTNSTETVKSANDVVDDEQLASYKYEAKKYTGLLEKLTGDDTVKLNTKFGEVNNTTNTEEPVIEEKLESRKKREIDFTNLPDAPSLPKLNLNILPDYIKAIMKEVDTPLQADEATFEDEIEQQIRNLKKAANHPPSVDDGVNDKREAKTYGMSLAGDGGEIWNDLNGAPVSYHIGELENGPSAIKPEELFATTIASANESTEDPDDKDDAEEVKLIDAELTDSENSDKQPITASNSVKLDIRFGKNDNIPVTEKMGLTANFESFKEEIKEQVSNLENLNKNVTSPSVGNKKDQKRGVRTYGMNLERDSGVVWNDLNASLVKYHVGKPEIVTSAFEPEEVSKTITIGATDESTEETSFEKVDGNENDRADSGDVDRDAKEIKESFDDIERMFEKLIKDSTSKPEVTSESNIDKSTKKPSSQEEHKPIVAPNKKLADNDQTSTPTSVNENNTNKPDEEGKPYKEKEINDRKDKNKETKKYKDEKSKQQQFVKELMKNKYIWKWLKDSSAAYLEIMMKKVDALIKSEVQKQIIQYFEEHKNLTVNYKLDGNADKNETLQEKPDKTSNITDINENITTENTIPTSTEPNKPSNDIVVVKKNNANETKNEELAKKHEDKESNDIKTKTPIKIEAQNIYGNSVGNGRVTNIFIFNISNAADLDQFKPIKNETNGVFIYGLDDKKPNQELVNDEITINKTEGNSTSSDKPTLANNITTQEITNGHMTTLKPNIDKESNVTEEVIEHTTKVTTESLKDSKKEIGTEKGTTEATTTETINKTTISSTTESYIDIEDKPSTNNTATTSENENISTVNNKTVTPEIKNTETTTDKSSTKNINTISDSLSTTESYKRDISVTDNEITTVKDENRSKENQVKPRE